MESLPLALESASKALSYSAVSILVGAIVVGWWLVPSDAADGVLRSRLTRAARISSAVAVGASAARLWAHTVVAFDLSGAFSWDNLRLIGLESRWGSGWRAHAIATVASLLAWFLARPTSSRRWATASVVAFSAIATLPLLGHGSTTKTRWAVHVTHLLGAGLWLGSLVTLVAATRGFAGERRHLLSQFSRLALPGATLLALTGFWLSWQYVGVWSNVMGTAYGQVLLVKLAVVVGVGACGAANWRRYRTPAPKAIGLDFVWAEVAFAVLVVAVTSVLTGLEHPAL